MNLNEFTSELLTLSSLVRDAELDNMPVVIRTDHPALPVNTDFSVAAIHFRREDGVIRCILDMGTELP
jgi:hypothetical protein